MSSNDPKKTNVAKIGTRFVWEYYNILNNDPDQLHEFFSDISSFIIGNENASADSVTSLGEIKNKIQAQQFKESNVTLSVVDCQEGLHGAISILVIGQISSHSSPPRKFVQNFLLAPQLDPKHYYVHNSTFRYLGEASGGSSSSSSSSSGSQPTTETPQQKLPLQTPETAVIQNDATPPAEPQATKEKQKPRPEVSHTESASSGQKAQEGTVASPSAVPPATGEVKKPFSWGVPSSPSSSPSPSAPAEDKPSASIKGSGSAKGPTFTKPGAEDYSQRSEVHSVYIRHLPEDVSEAQIREIFSKAGEIANITISRKGFGFVDYKKPESVKKAIDQVAANPIVIKGKHISVEEKKGKSGPNSPHDNRLQQRRSSGRFDHERK